MNELIDVLAVMDRLVGNTRTMAGLTGDPMLRQHLREGEEARAAVAELIEAAKHAREALAESNTDPLTVGKLNRALDRLGAS